VGSQIENLKSEQLAVAVIRQLKLGEDQPLAQVPWYRSMLRRSPRGDISGVNTVRPSEAFVLTEAENRVLKKFKERLNVSRTGDSRIVRISFAHEDPAMAARITNAAAGTFLDQYTQRRLAMIRQSEQLAQAQLEDVRARLESSKGVLTKFQRANGIADVDDKHLDTEGCRSQPSAHPGADGPDPVRIVFEPGADPRSGVATPGAGEPVSARLEAEAG
jgi:succinoglycan biosynthesis transport protein ExoP